MTTPSRLGAGETPRHDKLLRWIYEHPDDIVRFAEPILRSKFPSLFKGQGFHITSTAKLEHTVGNGPISLVKLM